MYPIDATAERLEAVEILGIPGLFTAQRVDSATVPKGMYAYELQTDPADWSQPCLLAKYIAVEHFGTVLTASPIALPERGYLDLRPGALDEKNGAEHLTVREFERKFLSLEPTPSQALTAQRRKPRTVSAPAR